MRTLERQLTRWLDAGLIDGETSRRIRDFEGQGRPARSPQPIIVEVFAYLGVIIVAAGVIVLTAANWEEQPAAFRVFVLAVPGAAVFTAGWGLIRAAAAGLRRGGAVAWVLAPALLTGAVGVVVYEAGLAPEWVLLVAGVAAVAMTTIVWAWNETHAQVVGLAAAGTVLAAGTTVAAAQYLSTVNATAVFGASFLLVFATGAVLVRQRVLRPELTASILSTLGFALGALYFAGGVAGRFGEGGFSLAFGGCVLTFALAMVAGGRPGMFVPVVVSGTLAQAGVALAAVFISGGAAAELVGDGEVAAVFGLFLVAFAAALAGMAETGVAVPRLAGRLLAAAGVMGGAFATTLPDGPPPAEVTPLLVGAGLVVLSVRRGTFIYMAAGIATIFLGLVAPVARHVDDPTLAALLMIGIGLATLGVLALVVRFRPWMHHPRPPGRLHLA